MLKVSKVKKSFSRGDTKVTAVKDVSVEVGQGKFVSIVGKSGSGKSTLLSLLGALDRPTEGEIQVDGKNIAKMSDRELTKYRNQKIGFVFQGYNLVPNLSALENVMLPMELAGVASAKRRKRAEHLLNQVELSAEKHGRKPGRLSGGEQQRVAIARALANQPAVILADEPTGNLDSATGKMIFDLLHNLSRSEGTTIVVVTHDLSIAGRTDATYTLKDGVLQK